MGKPQLSHREPNDPFPFKQRGNLPFSELVIHNPQSPLGPSEPLTHSTTLAMLPQPLRWGTIHYRLHHILIQNHIPHSLLPALLPAGGTCPWLPSQPSLPQAPRVKPPSTHPTVSTFMSSHLIQTNTTLAMPHLSILMENGSNQLWLESNRSSTHLGPQRS